MHSTIKRRLQRAEKTLQAASEIESKRQSERQKELSCEFARRSLFDPELSALVDAASRRFVDLLGDLDVGGESFEKREARASLDPEFKRLMAAAWERFERWLR